MEMRCRLQWLYTIPFPPARASPTEFAGSIVTPRRIIVNSTIVITYHLTQGGPLPEDMIVLLDNEHRDRIYASAEIVDAVGRSDLSLGSVMLKAPEKVRPPRIAAFASATAAAFARAPHHFSSSPSLKRSCGMRCEHLHLTGTGSACCGPQALQQGKGTGL